MKSYSLKDDLLEDIKDFLALYDNEALAIVATDILGVKVTAFGDGIFESEILN